MHAAGRAKLSVAKRGVIGGRRPKSAYPLTTEPIRRELPIAPCGTTTWGEVCPVGLAVIEAPWGVCGGALAIFVRQLRDRQKSRWLVVVIGKEHG
jgi:hypothetical protein